mmetsp:Transcript_16409/g.52190  ORF Transcript_16409/g.52190 Transcript_16409/m.52190 type:complete len:216 (-) Transcript_16409:502-1149(-)
MEQHGSSSVEMRRRCIKERLQHERLRHQVFNVVFAPLCRGQVLQEHKHLLKAHRAQLFAPCLEKCRAEVHVESLKAALLAEIRVPQPHDGGQGQLAQQQAVHPGHREVHKVQPLLREVLVQWLVDSVDELGQLEHHPLDARLAKRVMVLHCVQQVGQTPIRVGLDEVQQLGLQRCHITGQWPINIAIQEGEIQGGCNVVDALHIARCRVPNRPHV